MTMPELNKIEREKIPKSLLDHLDSLNAKVDCLEKELAEAKKVRDECIAYCIPAGCSIDLAGEDGMQTVGHYAIRQAPGKTAYLKQCEEAGVDVKAMVERMSFIHVEQNRAIQFSEGDYADYEKETGIALPARDGAVSDFIKEVV